ncbi:MAG: ABC transporter permease [Acidobacteria bacterium]|nr:ABC transporter permease [Acidobacteriota bacterium]
MSTTSAREKKPKPGAIPETLSKLYDRRWLVLYFIQRQLSSSYRKSFLGFVWIILTPLLMIVLYTLIFSEVVGLRFREAPGAANFGLYLYCGLIPFLSFSEAINQSVNSIRGNANLVQKVIFPVEIIPFSTVITSFVTHSFGLGVLVAVNYVISREIHWTIALLPGVMVVQLVFTLGLGYLMAVVGTYLPDVRETTRAITRALFFTTPIIWPPEMAYERGFGFLVDYNPLALLVISYRDLVLTGTLPDVQQLFFLALFAIALLVGAFLLFVAVKKNFADLI